MPKSRATQKKITILPELSSFIIPLSEDEFKQLEKNIIEEGCRDPLIVWDDGRRLILADGHNRHRICTKHGIPFKTKALSFNDIDEVKEWMINNQFGRRNLTPDQLSYYRGLKYLSLKRSKGGFVNVLSKGQKDLSTSAALSSQFNVSESTVKRDAKYAAGLNIVGQSNQNLKNQILAGVVKVKKGDVQILAESATPESIKIRNEADLHNKAKIIRNEILSEIENDVEKIRKEKIAAAQQVLSEKEPMFLKKDGRIQRIKGSIVSAINTAIENRNTESIQKLKNLIDRLADELIDE